MAEEAGITVVVVAGQTITRAAVVAADLAAVTIVTLAGARVVVAAAVVLLTHMMMIEGIIVVIVVIGGVEIATTAVLHLLIVTEVGDVEIDRGRDLVIVTIVEGIAETDTAVAGGGLAQDLLHRVMVEAAMAAGIVVIMIVHLGIPNILVPAVEISMDLLVVQSFLSILSSHLSCNFPTA